MAKIIIGLFDDYLDVKEVMEDLKGEAFDPKHIPMEIESENVFVIAVPTREEDDEERIKEFFELHDATDTKTLG